MKPFPNFNKFITMNFIIVSHFLIKQLNIFTLDSTLCSNYVSLLNTMNKERKKSKLLMNSLQTSISAQTITRTMKSTKYGKSTMDKKRGVDHS